VDKVTVVNNVRVSYNGGNGGINARPTAQEEAARNERHVAAVAGQHQQAEAARGNQSLRAAANHGKPPIAATDRPGAFDDHAVKAKDAGAPYNPPANRNAANANGRAENNARIASNPGERPNGEATRPAQPNSTNRPENSGSNNAMIHAKDLPPYEKPPAPNTGNAKLDQKYQQQQEKLAQQQNQQRQKLGQQQEKEHQQYQKQQADEARNQALEQKHQQQTQQLQQRQQAAQQQLQQRQAPRPQAAPAEHAAPAERKEK
jgi:hypothetical protein